MKKVLFVPIAVIITLAILASGVQAASAVASEVADNAENKLRITGAHFEPKEFDPAGVYGPENTTLYFRLSEDAKWVTVTIKQGPYWIEPRVVRHLVIKEPMLAGWNSVVWDGRDDNGKIVPREDDYSVPYVAVVKARSYTGERARAKATVLVMGTG